MNETAMPIASWFPRAAGYSGARHDPWTAGEPRVPDEFADPPTERLLQCVWHDAALRPAGLRTADGEPVAVLNPGAWNLEAGPDFLGASLRIGRGGRILSGDVEVHVRPMDWTRHRHGDDARYAAVRFHVTYHPGPPLADALPPGGVRIALRDALAASPEFSFSAIDPSAYPFAARAAPTPCSAILAGRPPDDREFFLESAGEERLRRKAERIRHRIADRGSDQAVYEELMIALGYKRNKTAFLCLAERLPFRALREESGGDAARARALLLGVSGLLPAESAASGGATAESRIVWDAWWKYRARWESAALPRDRWRLDGLRPLNRPERRLRAAAELVTRSETPCQVLARLAALPPRIWVREALAWLDVPEHEPSRGGGAGLLGRARAAAILVNVLTPCLAALDLRPIFDAGLTDALPDEPSNSIERRMAHTLFGPDHPPALRRGALRRQGLIQIFQDFCLNDRSGCASCGLPALLQTFRGPAAGA